MEKPTLPQGTRDFGPFVMVRRQFIFNTIRSVYQKFGFLPLETPAMENIKTLTGKYGDEGDKLIFKIRSNKNLLDNYPKLKTCQCLKDNYPYQWIPMASNKALRYDLTIPFARYIVMNRHEISLPFKRYQIQPVWRADKPQKGRYREFYQCDADVIGTTSLLCEAEIVLMIKEVFKKLNIQDYTIKINHRDILAGLAEVLGVKGKETDLYTAIDKLDKIGETGVRQELSAKEFGDESLDKLFVLLSTTGSNAEKLALLQDTFRQTAAGQKGVADLQEVMALFEHYGETDDHVEADLALARGLSYYTGTIFEVKINNVVIGSVSGGGRYDNLTQAFGAKEPLPGIGISFGVDRIYDAMEELGLFPESVQTSSKVLVCHFDKESMQYGIGLLAQLRNEDVAAEIYPDQARLKKQLDYANKKSIPFTVVIGSDEIKSGELAYKNMATGEQEKLAPEEIVKRLKH